MKKRIEIFKMCIKSFISWFDKKSPSDIFYYALVAFLDGFAKIFTEKIPFLVSWPFKMFVKLLKMFVKGIEWLADYEPILVNKYKRYRTIRRTFFRSFYNYFLCYFINWVLQLIGKAIILFLRLRRKTLRPRRKFRKFFYKKIYKKLKFKLFFKACRVFLKNILKSSWYSGLFIIWFIYKIFFYILLFLEIVFRQYYTEEVHNKFCNKLVDFLDWLAILLIEKTPSFLKKVLNFIDKTFFGKN